MLRHKVIPFTLFHFKRRMIGTIIILINVQDLGPIDAGKLTSVLDRYFS